MATRKQQREERLLSLFLDLLASSEGLRLSNVVLGDKPDVRARIPATSEVVGLELTELLLPVGGRDRHLEDLVSRGICRICTDQLAEMGDVWVEPRRAPQHEEQVRAYLTEFEKWVVDQRTDLLRAGCVDGRPLFPEPTYIDEALLQVRAELAGDPTGFISERAEIDARKKLAWLLVTRIDIRPNVRGQWRTRTASLWPTLAERLGGVVDEVLEQAVVAKCEKACAYEQSDRLWVVVRNPALEGHGQAVESRVAVHLRGSPVERVYVVHEPEHVTDVEFPKMTRIDSV